MPGIPGDTPPRARTSVMSKSGRALFRGPFFVFVPACFCRGGSCGLFWASSGICGASSRPLCSHFATKGATKSVLLEAPPPRWPRDSEAELPEACHKNAGPNGPRRAFRPRRPQMRAPHGTLPRVLLPHACIPTRSRSHASLPVLRPSQTNVLRSRHLSSFRPDASTSRGLPQHDRQRCAVISCLSPPSKDLVQEANQVCSAKTANR